MEKIIKYVVPAIAFFTLLCFFQTCGSKGKVKDNKKAIESLQTQVDSLTKVLDSKPSNEDVNYIMEQTMYKFLIYEEDLDKGRVSLSEIKNRIDE
jgi:hypothetical protein